jgi:hypothetical protein
MKCHKCQGGAPGYVCAGCIDRVLPKTNAERQRDYTDNRKREGLKQVRNLWAHPEDHAAIKALAQRLRDKRLTRPQK